MMGGDVTPLPEGIGATDLATAVRRAVGSDTAALGTWEVRRISEPRVATTTGVYAVAGVASDRGVPTAWSLVLKRLAPTPAGSLPPEVDLYRAGALAALSGGLRAPRCFGVVDLPGGGAAVWLAPVRDTLDTWPVTRFGLAAHHLGEFSATQTQGDPCASGTGCRASIGVPSSPPARRPSRRRRKAGPIHSCAGPARPLLQVASRACGRCGIRSWPPWSTCPLWSATATRSAATYAPKATGTHQALAYFDIDMDAAADLDREVCERYCDGLAVAGSAVDSVEVRCAYETQLALCLGVLELGWVVRVALDESRHRRVEAIFGRPVDEILERRAAIASFLLARARDACSYVGVTL